MEAKQRRKITRHRELRACIECRKRKLKCDCQMPCASCARRDEPESCIYEKLFGPKGKYERTSRAEAKLAHLEQLVQQLSERQPLENGVSAIQLETKEVDSHSHAISPNNILYSGATHWSAILEDIEELRSAIRDQDQSNSDGGFESSSGSESSLLFGAANAPSFQEVLVQFLPSRCETDRLVATYLRKKALAAPFIHSSQFNRLYRLFWDSPFTTSPLWTSILFSILHIASRTQSTGFQSNADGDGDINRFAVAAAYCLTIGQYYKPKQFAVEGLLLYAQSRCITESEISPDLAVIFGALVRVATMMGYHRDTDISGTKISAFDAEMRRRTWSLCMQLDMLVSFQLGLPSNVQYPTWDTRPPTNLLDSDFDEETVTIPPPRPDSEPTEIRFYIAKHRLMASFEKIIRHTLSVIENSDYSLETIDQELRNTYSALPTVFQSRPMVDSIVDPPSVVVTRLCVEFIYQKCLCVLHRKYIMRGRANSIQTCYDASSAIVRRFLDVYDEFQPGGQLQSENWFTGTLTWNDFSLGCTVLCLTLYSTRRFAAEPILSTAIVDVSRSVELLQKARILCEKPVKIDTRKVRQLLGATIRDFSSHGDGLALSTKSSVYDGSHRTSDGYERDDTLSFVDRNWLWNASTMGAADDPTWAYLEQQCLNFPNDDLMADILIGDS